MEKPSQKPKNPCFSSGPCAKRPGWSPDVLSSISAGRSHRAGVSKIKLKDVIDKHREILGIPEDYRIGIVAASDTGAFEMAMWSLLGQRGVDLFSWESFGKAWKGDATGQLKLEDIRIFEADYGQIPDLSQADFSRDVVFVWNGTTSGVRVPNGDWISETREGLTLCDATSAVFAYDLPWEKLDVTTWSWQKVLGSEAAHGMIVISPRVVERLENFIPDRPLPRTFQMMKKGQLDEGIFEGLTINTPSMLAVEDCLDALNWAQEIGGLKETIARSERNFSAINDWVRKTPWADFLADIPETRSITSVSLKIVDDWFKALSAEGEADFISELCKTLEKEDAAYDIKGYRDAPPGLRIWCGATVETSDVEALLPWLDWAYQVTKDQAQKKAA